MEDLGLSAQPYVSDVVQVTKGSDAIVIMASDGVWDVASSERAVQVRPLLSVNHRSCDVAIS